MKSNQILEEPLIPVNKKRPYFQNHLNNFASDYYLNNLIGDLIDNEMVGVVGV